MKAAAITLGILLAIIAAILILIYGSDSGSHAPPRRYMEIMMLSSAIESYKTEHGHYPTEPATTEEFGPNGAYDPIAYIPASAFLYRCLTSTGDSGSSALSSLGSASNLSPWMLRTNAAGVTYLVDPWGNSLGYSTLKAMHPESPSGNNPTFDLWSTCGGKSKADTMKWSKNW